MVLVVVSCASPLLLDSVRNESVTRVGASIYREHVNSKGAILEATVEYIHSLRKDQQKMTELMSRVEQLEAHERKLLLQREVSLG